MRLKNGRINATLGLRGSDQYSRVLPSQADQAAAMKHPAMQADRQQEMTDGNHDPSLG
ncbi:hypothetical protein [Ruegeria meonggei]|uniref:hypothetical protein n=1 Tax=Ruegeria meonggei TaxID=1446476 RepID=UPI001356714B|nr:hypothetical protein [Ruegeria meonggei]